MLDPDKRIEYLKSLYPNIDFSSSIYLGMHEFMSAVCPKHGEIRKKGTHWNLNGCVKCNKEARAEKGNYATEERMAGFKRFAAQKMKASNEKWDIFTKTVSDKFDFSKAVYAGTRNNVEVRCITHNTWFFGNPRRLTKGQTSCPHCISEKIKNSLKNTKEYNLNNAYSVHGERYKYLHIPEFIHEKAVIACEKHGEFEQTLHNHLQGTGCPVCAKSVSSGENEIFEFIKSLSVTAENRCRSIIPPKEIDIYLPDFKIGIEYHGLHWHADDRKSTTLKEKWKLCNLAGIRLIQIFEDEWIEKREIVESLLQSAIRKNGSIGARKLQVSQISAKDARRFLDKNHMQGFERAGLHLGLHLNTKIIAVASFSKPRFCDGDCELIRYASSLNVSGGLLKLIKEARSILEFKTLVSYCDMRLGTGESYIKAGFTLEGETPHDYWWFKKTKRIPRYRTQKHKLKSDPEFSNFYRDDLTEKEICSLAGYRKISGVGHKKFLLVM